MVSFASQFKGIQFVMAANVYKGIWTDEEAQCLVEGTLAYNQLHVCPSPNDLLPAAWFHLLKVLQPPKSAPPCGAKYSNT